MCPRLFARSLARSPTSVGDGLVNGHSTHNEDVCRLRAQVLKRKENGREEQIKIRAGHDDTHDDRGVYDAAEKKQYMYAWMDGDG
jgi:hypothetical protein